MAQIVRQLVYDAQFLQHGPVDKISVRNLDVTVNAGVDVWGRQRKQRAFVTVTLNLAKPFDSAAEADALDRSTVHYGKLSKQLQSSLQNELSPWVSTWDLAGSVRTLALQVAGQTPILSTDVDVFYQKGSMLGDGAGLSSSVYVEDVVLTSKVLYLRNLKIPCLIGVNSNERLQKQPVVVNLWVECLPASRGDDYAKLETAVVNVRALLQHWRRELMEARPLRTRRSRQLSLSRLWL